MNISEQELLSMLEDAYQSGYEGYFEQATAKCYSIVKKYKDEKKNDKGRCRSPADEKYETTRSYENDIYKRGCYLQKRMSPYSPSGCELDIYKRNCRFGPTL